MNNKYWRILSTNKYFVTRISICQRHRTVIKSRKWWTRKLRGLVPRRCALQMHILLACLLTYLLRMYIA